jgi:hypothetical protein
MANVTAKVKLTSKTLYEGGSQQLVFGVDYTGGKNSSWAAATPSLTLTMSVKNEVAETFVLGGAYTLTFAEDES